MKDRSLISFTLLSQIAVGLFIAQAACFLWFLSSTSLDQAARWCTLGMSVAAVLMLAAALISFFHLGNPRKAWLTASHFRTSWLSREIILVILFCSLSVMMAGMILLRLTFHELMLAVCGAAALVGLALLYTMSRIYRQRTLSGWNTRQTTAQFFLTALSTGVAGTSLLTTMNSSLPALTLVTLIKVMSATLVAALLLKIVLLILWMNPAGNTDTYREELASLISTHRKILLSHLVMVALAILAGSLITIFSGQQLAPLLWASLVITNLLVLASEIFARNLFFIARMHLGV